MRKKNTQHWTVDKWGEYTHYSCKYCSFDTLDEAAMREHYRQVHAPVEAKVIKPPVRHDRFGNPIGGE